MMNEQEIIDKYKQFYPLLYSITKNIHGDVELKKELISAGLVGFMEAVKKYNPRYGTKFSTYAYLKIKGEILNELKKHTVYTNKVTQYAEFTDSSIQDIIETTNVLESEEITEKREEIKKLRQAIKKLKPEYQELLYHHYFEDNSIKQISEESGFSDTWLWECEKIALNELKIELQKVKNE